MRYLILLTFFIPVVSGCKRDNDSSFETAGIVHDQKGCYPDSYLVEITGGAKAEAFLCLSNTSAMSPYNCRNAVFIHLPADLAVPGKKIRFIYTGTEITCYSSNTAPAHITVKSLRED